MAKIIFITHPEVKIDKDIDVRDWNLSEEGLARAEKMLSQPWVQGVKSVFASDETKAKATADKIAQKLGLVVINIEELGEIDRSSTGFLGEEFWDVVGEFFAKPNESARGWEKATDAQRRITSAVQEAVTLAPEGDIAIVSHGAVGALLLSSIKKSSIKQTDLASGQGYYMIFSRENWQVFQEWKKVDEI